MNEDLGPLLAGKYEIEISFNYRGLRVYLETVEGIDPKRFEQACRTFAATVYGETKDEAPT